MSSSPLMSPSELIDFLERSFPLSKRGEYVVEYVNGESLRLRLRVGEHHLRPGGTVSGPTIMALADTAMWLLIIGVTEPTMSALTSSLNIHFLRKPPFADLLAHSTLKKLGRRSATGTIDIFSSTEPDIVAHATVVYALRADPPAAL